MDTCVRGFSFMPETKVDMVDLKYVEGNDLERTWKSTRRERLKHQEEKIWEEFVKDQDIVRSICKDDPYQFVDQLPQECIKELLDIELQKMKQEKLEEIEQVEPQVEEEPPDHHVTFAEESEEDMFHIFDEDKDDDRDDDVSGPDEELLNESLSPPLTVRERDPHSPDRISTDAKSSNENVTNLIEGSIYCAKVKDLRLKIIDEMNNIMSFLEQVDIMNLEPADATRTLRRAAEFSARYGRVHLYQLHRQISDIERHNDNAPPFAARTHFQAQLCRVSSLHNNLLQALQVFVRSLSSTLCVRGSGVSLSSLVSLLSRSSQAARRARPPALHAANTLCDDAVQETCDKLVETLNEYTAKMTDYLNSTENTSVSRKSSKMSGKKKSTGTWSRSGKSLQSSMDARLSMYSLDTRLTNNKSTSSKEHSSGTSKNHASSITRSKETVEKEEAQIKCPKKSPRRRRPLMRAPGPQRGRQRAPRDQDVRTMVETVPCTSSHMSREASPLPSPSRFGTPRRNSGETATRKLKDNRKSLNNTPRSKIHPKSPKLDTNRGRETFRSQNGRPKSVEPSRNIEVELPRNIPVKESKDTIDNEVLIIEEDKAPEINVEMVNVIEKKEVGEEKIKKEKDRNRCTSSHMSREASPLPSPSRFGTPRRNSGETATRKLKDNRKSLNNTPRSKIHPKSPKLDTNRGRETFRSQNGRPKSVEPSRNIEVELPRNIPVKESKDTIDNEVLIIEEDKAPEINVEMVNVIEKKEVGEEKIKKEKDRNRSPDLQIGPGSCEVTRLLRQLCGGDAVGSRSERISGAKNAQLLCVSGGGGSPRPPSTPQLLRILEETIQKKTPKPLFPKPPLSARDRERYRMTFNIPERVTEHMFHYRTKFVQHMLGSALYANSAVGKPWEKIGRVSDHIIDELLLDCAKEMELFVEDLYKSETC